MILAEGGKGWYTFFIYAAGPAFDGQDRNEEFHG
jgi:hypothetical protein